MKRFSLGPVGESMKLLKSCLKRNVELKRVEPGSTIYRHAPSVISAHFACSVILLLLKYSRGTE
jgi:hypothetical protein